MAENEYAKELNKNLKTLLKFLKRNKYDFVKKDDNTVNVTVHETRELFFSIKFNSRLGIVTILSPVDVSACPERRLVQMAVAVHFANHSMVDGNFDYRGNNGGKILFRITTCFIGSDLSEDVFDYMLSVSYKMVKHYRGKFEAVMERDMMLTDMARHMLEAGK